MQTWGGGGGGGDRCWDTDRQTEAPVESSCQQSCNCHVMVLGPGGKVMRKRRRERDVAEIRGWKTERGHRGGRGVCLAGLESVWAESTGGYHRAEAFKDTRALRSHTLWSPTWARPFYQETFSLTQWQVIVMDTVLMGFCVKVKLIDRTGQHPQTEPSGWDSSTVWYYGRLGGHMGKLEILNRPRV